MNDRIPITPVFVPSFDFEGKLHRITCYQGTELYTDGSVGLADDNITIFVNTMKWGDKDKGTMEINWCAMGSQDVATAKRFAEALMLATRVVEMMNPTSDFHKVMMALYENVDHKEVTEINEVAGIRLASHRVLFITP